jgi:hypothetical protein
MAVRALTKAILEAFGVIEANGREAVSTSQAAAMD